MSWRLAPSNRLTTVGDYCRYPGAKLRLTCKQCGQAKGYDPERIIDRLRALRAGGHQTRISKVAERARPCPHCLTSAWAADFAWPAGMTESEVRRLANRYRN